MRVCCSATSHGNIVLKRYFLVPLLAGFSSGLSDVTLSGSACAKEATPVSDIVHLDDAAATNEGPLTTTVGRTGALTATPPLMTRVTPDQTQVAHIRPTGSGKVLEVRVRPGMRCAGWRRTGPLSGYCLHEAYQQRAQFDAALRATRLP